ncbi:glutamate transport membrane-spanning protein [Klebsiella pneumoniae]|uniref:Glutamate transport membrane-spanning protein n=1 Tax=Klebsiella pneumoniae TaxID=573 RepID=A0A2X3G7Y4_KLEPN|nr:glutamate transport membrane-spanning protein [Klebsiella pneumoniae]
MFIYFALPMAFSDLRIDPFSAAVVTIMINSGAYIAEITRGAVLSIHKGFREAGLALGLSRRETIRHVILPLALRRMLPPLGQPVDHQHQGYLAVHRHRRRRTDPSGTGDHRGQLPRAGNLERP